MTLVTIARIGPITNEDGEEQHFYVPLTAAGAENVVVATTDEEGLLAAVGERLGGGVGVGPECRDDGERLGFEVRPRTSAEAALVAEVALSLRPLPGLPRTPSLRRQLLEGMAILRKSWAYDRLVAGGQARADIWWDQGGQTQAVVATITAIPERVILVLGRPDSPSARSVWVTSIKPRYIIGPLQEAFELDALPVFTEEQVPLCDEQWFHAWGPAIAGLCHCVALLSASERQGRFEAALDEIVTVFADLELAGGDSEPQQGLLRGKVKWFNATKGYGMLEPERGG